MADSCTFKYWGERRRILMHQHPVVAEVWVTDDSPTDFLVIEPPQLLKPVRRLRLKATF